MKVVLLGTRMYKLENDFQDLRCFSQYGILILRGDEIRRQESYNCCIQVFAMDMKKDTIGGLENSVGIRVNV
jgi:hypothetical protein